MTPAIDKMPLYENPNAIPVKKKAQPALPPSSPSMNRNNLHYRYLDNDHTRSPRQQSQLQTWSPPQPVQPVKIHEDQETIDELTADNENLLDQLQKLTLKLDLANVQVSSQSQRITDLETKFKEKDHLVAQYQKMLRAERANKETRLDNQTRVVEQCEKMKAQIVTLSHRIHYMHTAVVNADIPDQLKEQFFKFKQEHDIVKGDLFVEACQPLRARKKKET